MTPVFSPFALFTVCGFLFARVLAAEELAAKPAAPQVSVSPTEVKLKPGQQEARLDYAFRNGSALGIGVKSRFAHFETTSPSWKSGTIGPFPAGFELPAGGTVIWQDNAWIPPEVLQEASVLKNGKVILAQSFVLRPNASGVTNLSTRVTFVLDLSMTNLLRTNFSTAYYEVTTLRSFTDDLERMGTLRRLLNYADKSYEALSKMLGFSPNPRQKIPPCG